MFSKEKYGAEEAFNKCFKNYFNNLTKFMKGLGNVKTFPEEYYAPSQTFNKGVLKKKKNV